MQYRTIISIDIKQKWGAGPWITEPDEVLFLHENLECKILRHPKLGHLIGYVGVSEKHELFGLTDSFEKLHNIRVHRGLTSFAKDESTIDLSKVAWWFGFDCCHFSDFIPAHSPIMNNRSYYRDINYVIKETKSLAEQLSKFKGIKIVELNRFTALEFL